MWDDIFNEVSILLADDVSGHSTDHVNRVFSLAMSFAEQEGADKEVVGLAALLHEVDDYKLFGQKNADSLINANKLLRKHNIDKRIAERVLIIIRTMGYNRYLEGVRPDTVEGKVVSDADMCDAIGAIGIIRTHAYNLSTVGRFFDKSIPPKSKTILASEYRLDKQSHGVQHFFDKLLRIPSILMTESGKKEGGVRQKIMIDFLTQLFEEESSTEWREFLKEYIK